MFCQWVAPSVAFRPDCECDTCDYARMLYYTLDESPMVAAWQRWFDQLMARRARTGKLESEALCSYQLQRVISATASAAQLELLATRDAEGGRGPSRLTS